MNTVYLDMDGVVADFDGWAQRVLGASTAERAAAQEANHWPDEAWERLKAVPNLYRNLPKIRESDLMVLVADQFRDTLGWEVKFLTAVPKNNTVPEAFQDKVEWLQEYWPGRRVVFGPYSADKYRMCKKGDILVDDRASNCTAWRRAGGEAVLVQPHKYLTAVEELKRLYRERAAGKLS